MVQLTVVPISWIGNIRLKEESFLACSTDISYLTHVQIDRIYYGLVDFLVKQIVAWLFFLI